MFIDSAGNLVLQPTCPLVVNGTCKVKQGFLLLMFKAVQCGELMINGDECSCDNHTISKKEFPWWCQLGWGSAKIISKREFNLKRKVSTLFFSEL